MSATSCSWQTVMKWAGANVVIPQERNPAGSVFQVKTAILPMFVLFAAGTGCSNRDADVIQYGGMRAVLRDGHTEPRIDLVEATRQPHAFGVGALENLGGEFTIVDGEVWVARKTGEDVTVSGPAVIATDRATLLTLSHVPRWNHVELIKPEGGIGLETFIEKCARAQGIDTSKPFPFVIRGEMTKLESHVIAGSCPLSGKEGGIAPWRLSITNPVRATLVGVFASDQAGIMTHHGSSVHMHVVMPLDGRTITAHVEEVTVGAGSILQLPDYRQNGN